LIKGDKWVEEEKQRIASVEAQPVVNTLLAKRNDLDSQIGQQQSTIDIVNGVKDKVLSVEDDLQYSVSAFEKQIENVRNQIRMDKKKQIVTAQQAGSWVNSLLNWLITLTTLIAIVFIVRYIMRRRSAFSAPGSPPLQR
jgi:predicted PurR-regulated permease PerM